MKNITKIIIGSMFALAVLVSGSQTFAQEDAGTFRDRIVELRNTHQALKAQVDAGEITATEARETWKKLLTELRADKEAFFEAKIDRVEAKYEQLRANNPERAAIFKEHIDAVRVRRAEAVVKRQELVAKVASGEITQQQANKMRVDFLKTQRTKFQEIRQSVIAKRKELKANRPDSAVRPVNGTRPAVRPGSAANAGRVRPRVKPVTGAPSAVAVPVDAVAPINSLTTN